jgi:hypothetical protein
MRSFDFEVRTQQGWNDDTMLTLAERFLKRKVLLSEFEKFLREVADEECHQVGDIVLVIPDETDVFGRDFVGKIVGIKGDLIQVFDQDYVHEVPSERIRCYE